jgi:large subunit ribosomal protein L31
MKEKIHPKYFDKAKVTCSCGNTFTTGSTRPTLRVEVCSRCHPFFTGEKRMMDTAGKVEKFRRRYKMAQKAAAPGSEVKEKGAEG